MSLTNEGLRERSGRHAFRARLDGRFTGPVLERAEGSLVYDVEGRAYLDFNSGQMCSALGHNHPTIVAAIREAAGRMIHASSSFFNRPEVELLERLCGLVRPPLARAFFLGSGSDANEAAVGIAKRYTGRYEMASPHTSFHGLNDTARSLTYSLYHQGYGPYAPGVHAILAPYTYRCPVGHPSTSDRPCCLRTDFACLRASFELLDAQTDQGIAGIITEPLFSAGGVIDPPRGWLARLAQMCRRRGAVLILDEAQTGLGKLGSLFAYEQEDIVPDVLTLSKHFGGGLEISAVVAREEIEERVAGQGGFVHGHSHSSDPLACAAALASLEVVVREDAPRRAREVGGYFKGQLQALGDRHELIGDVRGRGTLLGVELVRDRGTKEPANEEGKAILRRALERGLIFSVRGAVGRTNVLRFVPPLTTTTGQIDQAVEILDACLAEVRAA